MTYRVPEGFEWDPDKAELNQRRHGVSFLEACELFSSGADYLERPDEDHSQVEERFFAIGPITRGLAAVVYTERPLDRIRIISARWATPAERVLYRQHLGQQP
jgi:uncharacterized DUF497 family protein